MLIAEIEPDDGEIEGFGLGDFLEAEDVAIESSAPLLIRDEDGDVIDLGDGEGDHGAVLLLRRSSISKPRVALRALGRRSSRPETLKGFHQLFRKTSMDPLRGTPSPPPSTQGALRDPG